MKPPTPCALYACQAKSASKLPPRVDLQRQARHWLAAAASLSDLTVFHADASLRELEPYLARTLDVALKRAVTKLEGHARVLASRLLVLETEDDQRELERELLRFRARFLRTETLLDFYGDAVNTRTNARIGAMLRACDSLAGRFMADLLAPLSLPVPPVLTYLDRGLGASILKAGLRLWDGASESPVAAIKVVRHNLTRPTSILHEAGHQIAHETGYHRALADALAQSCAHDRELANLAASWASEIAADALAFVGVGYAAVAALTDVVSQDSASVFRMVPGDPHPPAYLRVRLNVALCRHAYGAGPWDELETQFALRYPLRQTSSATIALFSRMLGPLGGWPSLLIDAPYAAFGGRALSTLCDPQRVSPNALRELARAAGDSLFRSPYWLEKECVRALALSGYRIATLPHASATHVAEHMEFMQALGALSRARAYA